MGRFLNDQAKLVILYESGTYGVPTGSMAWPGLVQSVEISDEVNVIQTRFLGQGNRNIGIFSDGALDVGGTFTIFPQDWRMLGFALGSISVTSGTAQSDNYRWSISEVNGGQRFTPYISGVLNPWHSFTIEESRTGDVANRNHKRTIKGCVVNEWNLSIAQGNPMEVEVGVIGQIGSWHSGNSTTVTAGSNRPFLWSDAVWQIDGATQETVKSFTFNISNNFETAHYLNGSRVTQIPYPLNRDYNVEVAQDAQTDTIGSLYNTFFLGGSQFNAFLDINNTQNTGSHRLNVYFSGCKITEMTTPSAVGGISEISYTIVPGSVYAIAFDRNARWAHDPS